jgi:AbrB family looped-hinge helix DNA binding protein
MKTTIDGAGRVVIPRDIRHAAGLEPGAAVEIDLRDGVVAIAPAPAEIRIVKRGKLKVATTKAGTQPLTTEEVESIRDALRSGR